MSSNVPENQTQEENVRSHTQNPNDSSSWLEEIESSEQDLKNWHEQADRITKRFLDKRDSGHEEKSSKYNLFTVNTQILTSTLYAKQPKPLVTRQWEDQDDDPARVAAIIVERLLKIEEYDDFDCVTRQCVQDRLVPGSGQMWFRYVPTIVQEQIPASMDPLTGMQIPEQTVEKLVSEEVVTDYVYWKDFLWSPARTWNEVRWVGRKIKLSRQDAEIRFGAAIASQLSYTKGMLGDNGAQATTVEQFSTVHYATIYEIWCKRTRRIYWVSKGIKTCLDVKDDLYKGALGAKFFPCPKPLFALMSTTAVIPRPDFLLIQDQYEELDQVNERITILERAIKVVGAYDSTNHELQRIFETGVDNTMVAVQNFRAFAEAGGFKGSMDFIPMDMIVNALDKLRQVRADLVSQIYELSGISDIMRGATKASETLGAQELKAQYGAVRLQFLQMEVAQFVQEALTIRAKLQASLFQPQTMISRTNIMNTPDAPLVEPAIQLLKDPSHVYRVKVHADSMAVPEFNAEREGRLQYVRAISEFFMSMAPIIQQEPASAPFFLKIASWAVASFRTGREIEGVFDQFIKAAEMKAQNPPPPPEPSDKEQSETKLNRAKALETIAKTVGQTIENKFTRENPKEVLGQPPKPPASSSTH